MKNKLLFIWLSFLGLGLIGFWSLNKLVQSKFTAREINKILNQNLHKICEGSVEVSLVKIDWLPIGLVVQGIKLDIHHKEKKIDFHGIIETASAHLDFIDLFQYKFNISNLSVKNAKIIFENDDFLHNDDKSDFSLDKLKLYTEFKKLKEKIPFLTKRLNLLNIDVEIKKNKLELSRLLFEEKSKQLNLSADVDYLFIDQEVAKNFNIAQIMPLTRIHLDSYVTNKDFIKIGSLIAEAPKYNLNVVGSIETFDKIALNSFGKIDLSVLNNIVAIQKAGHFKTGNIDYSMHLLGSLKDFQVKANLSGENLDSDFVDLDTFQANVLLDKQHLKINRVSAQYKKGQILLTKPAILFDLVKKEFFPSLVTAHFSDFSIESGFKKAKKILYPLRGNFTGDLNFELPIKNDLKFKVLKGSKIKNFSFVGDKDFVLFSNPEVLVQHFNIEIKDEDVSLDVDSDWQGSPLLAKGTIKNGVFDIDGYVEEFDYASLGNLAGLNLLGVANADFTVRGQKQDVILSLNTQNKLGSILGFNLGNLDTDLQIDFGKHLINIENGRGVIEDDKYQMEGEINYQNKDIHLKVKHHNLSYENLKIVYAPIFSKLSNMPKNEEVKLNLKADYEVSGKTDLNLLKVQGNIFSDRSILYKEKFASMSTIFSFDQRIFKMDRIKLKKNSSEINGSFFYNTLTSKGEYSFNLDKIIFSDLDNYPRDFFQIDGNLVAKVEGKIENGFNNYQVDLGLNQSNVFGEKIPDSQVHIKNVENQFSYDVNLLGKQLHVKKSENKINEKSSSLFFEANILDIKNFLKCFLGRQMGESSLVGEFISHLDVKYNPKNIGNMDLEWDVDVFSLMSHSKKIKTTQPFSLNIDNGKIKSTILSLFSTKENLNISFSGDLNSEYKIIGTGSLPVFFLPFLHSIITYADGDLDLDFIYSQSQNTFKINSDNLRLGVFKFPAEISKIKLRSSLDKNIWRWDKTVIEFDSGNVVASGDLIFETFLPSLNLDMVLNQAKFKIHDKSYAYLNGKTKFIGAKMPYTLQGNLEMEKSYVYNEFSDFQKEEEIDFRDKKFFPKVANKNENAFLRYDLNVVTKNPFIVKNSMFDMSFMGDLKVKGDLNQPEMEGVVNLAGPSSRMMINNSTFQMLSGKMNFSFLEYYLNPKLDFVGKSNLGDYEITLLVSGAVDNYKVQFDSRPSLSSEDILSLLTFGYKISDSNQITDSDRNSMVSTRVGSLILNSLSFNKLFKSSLGLDFSLGTDTQNSQQSYFSKSNVSGTVAGGQNRSSTKIEISKNIGKNLAVSAFSTVGSSAGLRQGMRVKQKIKNNISLEGVFDVNSNEENQESFTSSSIGADLKFKWNFE